MVATITAGARYNRSGLGISARMFLGATVVGATIGACSQPAFLCQTDADCRGVADGQCEATSACSLPDPACDSGRRYSEFAGELAGICVEPEAAGSTGTPTDARGSTSEGPGPTSNAVSQTGEADSSDGGSSGLDGDTTGDHSTTGRSDTSGEPVLGPCLGATVRYYDFESVGLSRPDWVEANQGGGAAMIARGHLALSGGGVQDSTDNYWWTNSQFELPNAGTVAVEVVQPPLPSGQAAVWLSLIDGTDEMYIDIQGDQLRALVPDAPGSYVPVAQQDFDPVAHRWLSLDFDLDAGTFLAQTSPDGQVWTLLHQFAGSLEADALKFGVGGGYDQLTQPGVFAEVDNLALCEPG